MPPDFPRTARASRASRASRTAPRGLCGSHREAVWQPQRGCVAATQAASVWKPHRGCVAATQGLLLCHNSILWLLRSHNSCVGLIYKLYMPVKQARIRPENIDSATNGVGKLPFGLKLCVVRALHLRMPPACPICQKTKKSIKNRGFGDFRAPAPPGPISALFPVDALPWMHCRGCIVVDALPWMLCRGCMAVCHEILSSWTYCSGTTSVRIAHRSGKIGK